MDTRYAGFWIRAAALLIDFLILCIACYFLPISPSSVMEYFSYLISISYGSLFIASAWQATPGKRLVGIYVRSATGQRLSISRALLRVFMYWIPGLPILIWQYTQFGLITPTPEQLKALSLPEQLLTGIVLGMTIGASLIWYLIPAFTKEKTTITDMLMGTRVVHGRLKRVHEAAANG